MLNSKGLLIILFLLLLGSLSAEERIKLGFSGGLYTDNVNKVEADNMRLGLFVSSDRYVLENVSLGGEVGILTCIDKYDIPFRLYSRIDFKRVGFKPYTGIMFRNTHVGRESSESGYGAAFEVGGILNIGWFYMECSKAFSILNEISDSNRVGIGITYRLM